MSTPALAFLLSAPDGSLAKKKRVLLLDTSQTKRDLLEAIRNRSLFATETIAATETTPEREDLL